MRGIRLGVMIGAGVVVGALGVVPSALADSAPPMQSLAQSPAAVRAYWTGARMRDAKPADAIPPSPLAAPGGAAVSSAAKRSSLHERVAKTTSYPNRTDGKVFFTLPGGPPDGGDYVCSGTGVRSPGRSLVWTAGHCVFDPGVLGAGYATHWEFVPAYNEGRKPFGEWPATSLATTQQWHGAGPISGGDSAFDFGAATVAPRGGQLLQDRIGARRLAFNYTRNQTYTAFGYPAEQPPPEFDGEHMFKCRSPYRGSDDRVGPPPAIRISCDMTGGSSGGGWVIRRDGTGYVASVTSYGYNNDPNGLYGPYQGSVARSLARSAGG
jgi:hypothetical protein